MSTSSLEERRHLERTLIKRPASVIIERGAFVERVPCIVLDTSAKGLRIGGVSRVTAGQIVDVIWDEHDSLRCKVVWAGKVGSVQQGQAGLRQTTRSGWIKAAYETT